MMLKMPFGGAVRLLAVVVTALVAFMLGQFSIFGFEFLVHWQLSLRGWLVGFLLFSTAWGTGLQYIIWARAEAGASGESGLERMMRSAGPWLGGLLALLLCASFLARQTYHCILIAAPVIGLLIFAVIAVSEVAIVRRLRATGRDGAGFSVLLVLEAVLMFSIGEIMAVDHFRKGLVHFEKDHTAIWSITSAGNVDFVVDYGRKEFVLSARDGAPFELRRSFANRVCK